MIRLRGSPLAARVGLGVALTVLATAAPVRGASVESHNVTNGGPYGITAGPGNSMTVGARDCGYLGQFDVATATLTTFLGQPQLPCAPGSGPSSVVVGPEGKIYTTVFGSMGPGSVASVETNGSNLTQSGPVGTGPLDIIVGPDNNVWFTVNGPPGRIGRVSPGSPVATTFDVPGLAAESGPRGLISHGGFLYLLGGEAGKIWRVQTGTPPTFTEVGGSLAGLGPSFGEVGPDGNLWFTLFEADKIARLIPGTGAVTQFGNVGSGPFDLAFGSDGKAYVTNNTSDRITQFDPATGATVPLELPTTNGMPARIAAGPDGHLYAAGEGENKVYEVTPDAPPTTADTTRPETTITKPPKKKLSKKKARKAKVAFSSNETGASFECRLDTKSFAPCISPARLGKTKKGKHVFAVRAADAAGNIDASPATAKFKVKKPRR